MAVESLEPRVVLTIAPGLIPESLLSQTTGTSQPTLVQTAFAPGVSTLDSVTGSGKAGVQASYYEFSVVRSTGPAAAVSFSTQVNANSQMVDVALALYDTDGNLLRAADADSPSSIAGRERLVATLESARPYVLGVFSRNDNEASLGGDPITVTVDTGEQRVGSTIKVDPATGKGSFSGLAAADRLQGAGDVDYFPLALTNLGKSATITLQPNAGSGMQLYGEIYRREIGRGPWVPVASAASAAAGGGVTLLPQSAPGVNLNDSEFLLAVAAKGLELPAQGYRVTIDGSQSLLVPSTMSKVGATDIGVCLPSAVGVATATFKGTGFLPSTYLVRATVDGKLRLNVENGFNFKPILSVYDTTDSRLLGVASRTTDGSLALTIDAKAGRQYVVRMATSSNKASSAFTLTASQSYVPTELAATAVVASTKTSPGLLNLDPGAGGTFLRITPAAGADILVLRLAAATGSVTATPQMWIFLPNASQSPTSVPVSAAAGKKSIDYAIDLTKTTGPFDLFITGTGGTGSAELTYAAATLPRSLAVADVTAGALDLQKGTFSTAPSKGSVPFGTLWSKAAFTEVGGGATEKISTTAAGPAAILEYVRQAGAYVLRDWSLDVKGTPSLSGFVPGKQSVGVASMSLALTGGSGLGISVAGPQPRAGVGVAMVPDLTNPMQTLLQIRNQYLESLDQRDLWETLLPGNVLAKPQELRFEPTATQGTLRAKVSVLDATDKVLVSGTSLAGQPLVLSLAANVVSQLVNAGGKVRFLVEPLAGSPLGDGGYSLKLTAASTDSRPFELTETRFYPFASKSNGFDGKGSLVKLDGNGSALEGVLPATLTIAPVNFGGVADGEIKSKTSVYFKKVGDADSIDVFSFKLPVDAKTGLPNPKPFEIYTTEPAGSKVDTTIGLYIARRRIDANDTLTSAVESYEQVDNVSPSRDYYPSDRSAVDARIVVNNPSYLYDQFKRPVQNHLVYDDNVYTLYIVVKAQYGTTGSYQLHVAPTQPQEVGPRPAPEPVAIAPPDASAFLDPVTGKVSTNSGAFGFNVPGTLIGGSAITATIRTANAATIGGQVYVDVSDAQNNLLYTRSVTAAVNTLSITLDDVVHEFKPANRYYLRVRSPQPGLVVNGVDLEGQMSAGSPVAAATSKVGTKDGGSWHLSPQLHRNLVPAPDGHASGTLTAVGGAAQVQDRVFFYVEADGQATFTVTSPAVAGGTWALYRLKDIYVGELNTLAGDRVDFVQLGVGPQTFVDYLHRGSYMLELYGSAGQTANAGTFDVQLPAFSATDIQIDPNTGNNAMRPLLFHEPDVATRAGDPAPGDLSSQYMRVVAPADAAKNWTFDLAFQNPQSILKWGEDGKESPTYQAHHQAVVNSIKELDEVVATKDTLVIYKRNTFLSGGLLGSMFTQVDFTLDPTPKFDEFTDPNIVEPIAKNASVRVFEKAYGFTIAVNDQPLPGDEYFIGHHAFLNSERYFVGPHFTLPESGDPDLVVEGITLLPNHGQTSVDIEIRNEGYGSAGDFAGVRTLSNYTPKTSTLDFLGLGGHAGYHRTFEWKPDNPSDFVAMLVNQPDAIQELTVKNNFGTVALSSVDPNKPTASITLKDGQMDGEQGAVWGRYLSGVMGVPLEFSVTADDVDKDYYQTKVFGLVADEHEAVNGTKAAGYVMPFSPDAGSFQATTADNPNETHYQVFDQYGLRTDEFVQRVDVVPKPGFWRDNTGDKAVDGIHWNAAAHGYDLVLNYNFVNYDKTVQQLLGSVPFIGDKRNTFTINVAGSGFASLDPEFVPDVPIVLTLLLKVVDEELYNEQYNGSTPIGDHATLTLEPVIDSRLVDLKGASISLQLRDEPIAHVDSPKVPVYSIGVPGIASFDINLGFSIDVTLDAGVKLGVLFDPFMVGLMAPTFLKPAVTPSATISGDVKVLGLPLAGIEGSIGLEIDLAAGLANVAYDDVIPFDKLFDNFNVGASFQLDIGAKATLAGATVWSTDYKVPLGSQDTGGVVTKENGEGAGAKSLAKAMAMAFSGVDPLGQPLVVPPNAKGSPIPLVLGANAIVQNDGFLPVPQMVIDPQSGAGLLMQTVQVDSSEAGRKKGVLQVANRGSLGAWSVPVNLPSADASNPLLALTHDAAGKPAAVVVYEGLSGYDSPSGRPLGDVLARHDLKYRYYDGVNWAAETPLTPADGLYDSQAAVAFNAQGKGVAAWVHNTSAAAFAADGSYASGLQDVQAAVWNAATHSWSAPLTISPAGDGVGDVKPSAVVDAAGNAIVTWIRDTGDVNSIFFSRYDGKAWSAPAEVPVDGMTPGNYGEVSLGIDDQGLVNMVFSHRVSNADGTLDSRLFNRATVFGAFGQAAGFDQISKTYAGYSHLRTTSGADGKLVAYWQQSDGVNDGVYATALTKAAGSPRASWSAPAKLTTTRDVTRVPSIAIDVDGRLQTLYVSNPLPPNKLLFANRPLPVAAPTVAAPTATGIGSVSYAPLPELSFSSPLSFDGSKAALGGTTAIGRTTIVNTGMAGDTVTVRWFQGLPGGGSVAAGGGTLLGTRTITLSPGGAYALEVPFSVVDGPQTYSVQVSGTKGEAISTLDDVTSTTLVGKPDIVVESLVPSIAAVPGAPETFTATIANLSDMPVGGFDVELYAGDPVFSQNPVELLATKHVDGLAGNAKAAVQFSASLPFTRGIYTFTVRADSAREIDEVAERNNDGHFTGRFEADPAIAFDAAGKARLTATLLDGTGINNVEVKAVVRNGGDVALTNLPVHLTASRNDGQPQPVGDQVIPSLAPGAETTLTFVVSGLDGMYRYRASLDDAVEEADDDTSNNTGTTTLVIHGMADLVVVAPSLSTQTPMQGWPLSLQATVGNIGIADAKGVLVEVFAKGRDAQGNGYSILVGGITIDVEALSHQTIALPVDTTRLLGNVVFTVRVNRFHTVLESNELNDTVSIPAFFAPKIIPQVTLLSAPAAGTSVAGASLDFTATFNEPVTVVGQPAIGITVGQKVRTATYVSGNGSGSLLFRMTVAAGDLAPNGIGLTGLTFPAGSSIRDAIGTAALAALPPTDTSGIRIDAVPPSVLSIVAPAAKTYGLGQPLTFQVIFSESVTVSGTPSISLKVGTRSRAVEYVGGSGTAVLLFRYVVQAGDLDNVGVVLGRSLLLASTTTTATIRDAAGNAAGLALPLAKTTGVKVKA